MILGYEDSVGQVLDLPREVASDADWNAEDVVQLMMTSAFRSACPACLGPTKTGLEKLRFG